MPGDEYGGPHGGTGNRDDDERDDDAAAAAAAAGIGGATGGGVHSLVTGLGGAGSPTAGPAADPAKLGETVAEQLVASSGGKVGALAGLAVARPDKPKPLPRRLWDALRKAVGAKGAVLAFAAVVVGLVLLASTAVVVLGGSGGGSGDDVQAAGPGGDDEGDEAEDSAHVPSGGDKDEPSTIPSTPPTTTPTAEGRADGEDEDPGGSSGPGAGTPTDSPSDPDGGPTPTTWPPPDDPTTTTTTRAPAPLPTVVRFTATWDTSGQLRCSEDTTAMTFNWVSTDAVSATLAPTDGRASYSVPVNGPVRYCAYMLEEWRITVANADGRTATATTVTPYLG